MTALAITVLGDPVGQGRVSGGGMRQTKGGRLFRQPAYHSNRAKLDPWRERIAWQVRQEMTAQGVDIIPMPTPVELHATFTLKRPKQPKAWAPVVRPDLDHYVRALCDALSGVLIEDDSQVVSIQTSKVYPHDGAVPGVTFTVAPAVRGEQVAA